MLRMTRFIVIEDNRYEFHFLQVLENGRKTERTPLNVSHTLISCFLIDYAQFHSCVFVMLMDARLKLTFSVHYAHDTLLTGLIITGYHQ